MPVPVPTRSSAHTIKKHFPLDASSPSLAKQSTLRHLLNSLPEPPIGPPPAFTDRETWIKSLPPSRRYKVRQETVTSSSPLPAAGGAQGQGKDISMSKTRATVLFVHTLDSAVSPDQSIASDALISVNRVAHAPLSNGKPWPPSPPTAIKQAIKADERRKSLLGDTVLACDSSRDADDELSEEWTEDEAFFAGPTVYRQASGKRRVSLEENKENVEAFVDKMTASNGFNPVVEFDSDIDVPLAPFDGTLTAPSYIGSDSRGSAMRTDPAPAYYAALHKEARVEQNDPSVIVPARKPLSPIPTIVTPADMLVYNKKVAEPMSDWVSNYIWKVVTSGMSLPPEFTTTESGYGALSRAYPTQPPAYLADSIRTLLCATLLQPSAIFLALWYIARFPVSFGVFSYNSKAQSKEYKFRLELLGEGSGEPAAERTRQLLEAHAPFRLFLLGVMLANKWLDDNTFSNKTWYQVSGVPMRALNKLESLGLDLLSHDLSMLPRAWEQWLDHVQNYHRSLAPYPEPIGPPKDTPHVIIRRTIEDLIAAGSPPLSTGVLPEPVFLGLEERKKERERERLAKEQNDLLDFDLDEDGPLRQEYLPKRVRVVIHTGKDRKTSEHWAKELPPPAEWSPAGDPPIQRARQTYHAVQRPPPAPVLAHAHAHVVEPAFHISQANGYFNRDTTLQDARVHGQTHMQAHGYRWSTSNCYNHTGQSSQFAFAQSGPISVIPPYSLYSNVAIPSIPHPHFVPWTGSFVSQQVPGSEYQPVGTFDAPPASELFRPTWLRT